MSIATDPHGFVDVPHNTILCGDSIELIKRLPSNSVHLILSDIPYGIGLDDWDVLHANSNSAYGGASPAQGKAGAVFKKRGKPINGWSEADKRIPYEYQEWCSTWAAEWLRVLKPGGSVMIFAGRRFSHRAISALEDAGFNFRDLLGWTRPRAVHRAQRISIVFDRRSNNESSEFWEGWRVGNLKPTFEPIIWAFKPYRITIADNVLEHQLGAYNQDKFEQYFGTKDNVFECGMAPGEGGLHPAQKPVRLMEALIDLVTIPGQTVIDPFAGSGTTGVAANKLGRNFILMESNPELCEVARKRIIQPKQQQLI
ncbi:DNA-methyltransferase [Pseudomonas fragi]|uniref:Methyltransferase n=1 Tax=Pseudomonas fragi TaxID=296 RepID=A0A9Q6YD34_PSEFR|nr:site-specific DNA-methyltransferase [Pseudomonas fragi]QPL30522.1 site-specific DNA-methyltransferase [Pseudomonas fragi]